jgi:methyl-accepting chemotaxis protein
MAEVVESVRRVTDIMAEITAASVEQSAGIAAGQPDNRRDGPDDAAERGAGRAGGRSAAAMQEQAARLARAVSVFKLQNAQDYPGTGRSAEPRLTIF